MCVIIYKPQGILCDDKYINNSIDGGNRHGFGIMRAKDNRVSVIRTLDMNKALSIYREDPEGECFMHFRFGTHGNRDESNCHPSKVTKGLYMMHNGIAPVPIKDKSRSDTWHVARILQPMFERDKGFLESAYLSDLLSLIGGSNSKYTFLRRDGAYRIVNQKAGMECDGMWFSNSTPTEDPRDYNNWGKWDWFLEDLSKPRAKSMAVGASLAPATTATTAHKDCVRSSALDSFDDYEGTFSPATVETPNVPTSIAKMSELSYDEIAETIYNYPDEVAELIWKYGLGG